ncbi:hypothetical protein NOR51B_1996 [Luminiphilus syltensis NOR5-1B]|uniref:Uncharacterized protein n=1 Tax=Luminiphilus syltensis NOR5-1B TaxID=565045 RepID=B8KXZ6_9GAMM|nr:hypothetical protein NOR51B_1996 [Luminiphilus syltensis NOR5-1B]
MSVRQIAGNRLLSSLKNIGHIQKAIEGTSLAALTTAGGAMDP